jgi:hypothetical protein
MKRVLAIALLVMLVALGCGEQGDQVHKEITAVLERATAMARVIESVGATWEAAYVERFDIYAEKVCDPLSKYIRRMEQINDKYDYQPGDTAWPESMPMLREMAVVAGDFADDLESIDVVPLDVRVWHEGVIKVGRYPGEAVAALDSGRTQTLGPMPEFPETPEELVEAITKHCGPDLLPEP